MTASPGHDAEWRLADALRAAGTVTVLTGSGISAESGVPTFRDAGSGLWSHYRPEDIATPEAFERNPAGVWQWYAMRRRQLREVEPNAGHRALAALARHLRDLRLVTQNVDGLHQRAGHEDVVEFHGSLLRDRCQHEGRILPVEGDPDEPPHCPHCGAYVRPDVVWFGEAIPGEALERAAAAAEACDLFLAIGTTAAVEPAASLARTARSRGAGIAEINPEETELTRLAETIVRTRAAEALPRILEAVEQGPR